MVGKAIFCSDETSDAGARCRGALVCDLRKSLMSLIWSDLDLLRSYNEPIPTHAWSRRQLFVLRTFVCQPA